MLSSHPAGENNDQQDEDAEVKDMCQDLYESAGKCEENLDYIYGHYPTTTACEFIEGLTVSDGKTRIYQNGGSVSSVVSSVKSAAANVPGVLAGLFALSTLILAGVAYHYNGKANKRANNLKTALVSGDNHPLA